MKLLASLTEFFFTVFGITRPKPEQVRVVNLIIGGLMLVVLIVICTLVLLIFVY